MFVEDLCIFFLVIVVVHFTYENLSIDYFKFLFRYPYKLSCCIYSKKIIFKEVINVDLLYQSLYNQLQHFQFDVLKINNN